MMKYHHSFFSITFLFFLFSLIPTSLLTSLLSSVLILFATPLYAETTVVGGQTQAQTIPDVVLVSHIYMAIKETPDISNVTVAVSSQDNVISVAGTVPTVNEAIKLVETIAMVKYVKDIFTDQLTVPQAPDDLSDLLITADIKGAIIREKIFGDKINIDQIPINVLTTQGIVYLTGAVDSVDQINKIVVLIQLMKSVPRVISMLTIQPSTVYVN